jgi:hypothetical protein
MKPHLCRFGNQRNAALELLLAQAARNSRLLEGRTRQGGRNLRQKQSDAGGKLLQLP